MFDTQHTGLFDARGEWTVSWSKIGIAVRELPKARTLKYISWSFTAVSSRRCSLHHSRKTSPLTFSQTPNLRHKPLLLATCLGRCSKFWVAGFSRTGFQPSGRSASCSWAAILVEPSTTTSHTPPFHLKSVPKKLRTTLSPGRVYGWAL